MASEVVDPPPNEASKTIMASIFWCTLYGSGIIGTLLVYGLLQERIMAVPYDGERFEDAVFLVFSNRCANCIFALLMIAVKCEPIKWTAPLWKYIAISVSNVLASTCQYEALKYVIFPVQMLGKSFKMMPVMAWGIIVSGKRYGLTDWLVAGLVTLGVTEFLLTGPISSGHGHHPAPEATSLKGLALIIGFLAFDGFTSTFQEHIFKEHKASKYNQMLYVNAASSITSFSALIAGGGFSRSLAFASRHPSFLMDASMLSGAAASSQWFIYSQIKEFGALVFAATMNVRQLVSIIVSYMKFGHVITPLQVVGLALVFGGLFVKSYTGLVSKDKGNKAVKPLAEKDLEKASPAEKLELLNHTSSKDDSDVQKEEPSTHQDGNVSQKGSTVPLLPSTGSENSERAADREE
mmetsp:Transcript_53269/g.98484  ORF Transcript_53269/g.98484 Transcript_53269/m.98484 type:complete len:407 (-) Transcript_53269:158-1378(-)